jgi:hypothetical protein
MALQMKNQQGYNRRDFLITGAAAIGGLTCLGAMPPGCGPERAGSAPESRHIIGPRTGFTPQVGTLVSMLDWMRNVVVYTVQGLEPRQLDYLHDPKANTIGALLLHLAALEVFYQVNTFTGRRGLNGAEQRQWQAALDLGAAARKQIRGKPLAYYLETLHQVREQTLSEFRRRDDQWLTQVDPSFFDNQPTNNYCKWFHVCEHESNHNGQIKWLKSRLPF